MGKDPRSFFKETVVFWEPEILHPKVLRHMPCPNCGNVWGHVTCRGWNEVIKSFDLISN